MEGRKEGRNGRGVRKEGRRARVFFFVVLLAIRDADVSPLLF